MLNNYMAILSLNESEDNIKGLAKARPLCSIPIGGRYRIIDFVMSNLVNSSVDNIGILAQVKSRSLIDHLGSGKPWDLVRKLNGLFIFNFGLVNSNVSDIEILKNNIEYLYRSKKEYVILSSSNMICNINYEYVAEYFEKSGADITAIYKKVKNCKNNFSGCNVLNINKDGRAESVGINMGMEEKLNISMDMFIMKKELLLNMVNKCIKIGFWESLRKWIYKNLHKYYVNTYEFKGYLSCINSTLSYYKTSMDMLNPIINRELFFKNGQIYTKVMDEAPTRYFHSAKIYNSIIADGCLVDSTVENSIISRRVIIKKGAVVKNSIIIQNCEIEENAVLDNVIVDKNNIVAENTELKGDKEFPLVIEKTRLLS